MKAVAVVFAVLTGVSAALLPTPSVADPDPTLLGFNWWVHLCKKPDSKDNCTDRPGDHRKLLPHTRFGLHRDDNNDFWLELRLPNPNSGTDKPLMELSIPIIDLEFSGDDEPPTARFSFRDFDDNGDIVEKTMTIALLRRAGQSTTSKSCAQALEEHSNGKLIVDEREEQCSANNVVHWRIRQGSMAASGETDPPDPGSFDPPGDGQGSGSDEPPS